MQNTKDLILILIKVKPLLECELHIVGFHTTTILFLPSIYLKKIMKGAKLTDTAFLSLGNDYPLKIEYKIRDKMSLQFILAPRVQND